VWSGAYANGPLWAVFALGKTAIVISTNTLSPSQLLSYIGAEVCTGKLHADLERHSLMSGAGALGRYRLTTPLRALQAQAGGSPWQSDATSAAAPCSGAYSAEMQSGVGPISPPLRPGGKSRQHTNAYFAILSTGANIPNLVMTVDSRGSWTPMQVTATRDAGKGQTPVKIRLLAHTGTMYIWDYGPLPNGAVARIYLQLHLANPCCYQIFLRSYGNLKNGQPDPNSLIPGASGGMGGSSSSSAPPPPKPSSAARIPWRRNSLRPLPRPGVRKHPHLRQRTTIGWRSSSG
jgi:hypothetical protein